ncbi:unnamed protein product [Caenorhabditis brenneri]
MPTAVTVGESVKTNRRSTVRSPVYEEESIGSDEERGDSEDEEYEPVDHGIGKGEESEEDEASPRIESKKNEAQKSTRTNSKKRKSRRPKRERKEKKRSLADPYPAQDEGPSTSGIPPDFQLVGISRSSSYSTTSIPDPEEEPPSRNLPVEGTVNEGYAPAAPSQFLIREPEAHQLELVAQDRQPDQELHDTTSLQENQRGFVGPLRDPQRAGSPMDAMLPAANDELGEERPEPNEEGPEDLEEDQGRAASPAPQEEEEANRVVQDQSLQPLEWLEQYRGAQLFEGHPPHQEHARIREDDVPVLQQEMPREPVELHGGEELLLQGAIGEEMPLLHPIPQDHVRIFEDNELDNEIIEMIHEDEFLPHQERHHRYHINFLAESGPLLPDEYYVRQDGNGLPQEHIELGNGEIWLPAQHIDGEVVEDRAVFQDNNFGAPHLAHHINEEDHEDRADLHDEDIVAIEEDRAVLPQFEHFGNNFRIPNIPALFGQQQDDQPEEPQNNPPEENEQYFLDYLEDEEEEQWQEEEVRHQNEFH